jgi:hypothetical protein
VRVLAASARGQGARVFIALLTPTKPGRRMIPLGIVQAATIACGRSRATKGRS